MGTGVVHPGGDAVHSEGCWHDPQNNKWTLSTRLQGPVLMSANEDPVTWLESVRFRGSSCVIHGPQLGQDPLVG